MSVFMAPVNCQSCTQKIGDDAERCPHCGNPQRRIGNGVYWIFMPILLIVAVVFVVPLAKSFGCAMGLPC
jgi:predicted amidophosphoribosyltransferase